MTPSESEPDVRLTLRPLPDEVPTDIRLRRLLKYALRALGLRCVKIEDLERGPRQPGTIGGHE